MKKVLTLATTIASSALLLSLNTAIAATPSVEEVNADVEAIQGYFKQRFPEVALEDYSIGVNALPQYADRRANWEMMMEFPPYEEFLDKGNEEWATPFANGTSFEDCFANSPSGNEYPYVDGDNQLHTIETDIRDCLKANGEEAIKGKSQKMARLTMAYKSRANGQPLTVDYSSEAMRDWYAKGRDFYWQKRGQLNFSCADCHVLNAGNSVRGDVLSAGVGHGTGFPVFRTKWDVQAKGKPLGTMHRRYGGCNKNIRAEPFKALSDDYLALEVYEAIISSGVPIQTPSQRQ